MKKHSNEMTSFIGCTKFVLIMMAVSLLLLLLPSVTSAQEQPPSLPCRFHGTVQLDGSPAPDGTVVAAMIGGREVASAVTKSVNGNSTYSLTISQPEGGGYSGGTAVEFSISGYKGNQTGTWEPGGNVALNVTASTPPPPTPTLTPTPTPTPTPVPTATPTPTPVPTPTPKAPLGVRRIVGIAVFGILALLLLGVLAYLMRRWYVR